MTRLDPRRKVVDSVADLLAERARRTEAAASLAHVAVVVPTAESGRRLRRALAKRLGALVPPEVLMPAMLVAGDPPPSAATRTDEIVAFMEALGPGSSVDEAARLCDLRTDLGANALSFADVALRAPDLLKGEAPDVEMERWRTLAATESRYLAALARRGLEDRVSAVKRRLASRIDLGEAEEIVVACVLDPLPAMQAALDASGLPVEELLPEPPADGWLPLSRSQIFPCGTSASESWRVADVFASVSPGEAYPALCLADQSMFPDVKSALQAKGVGVHDTARTRLSTSSLGRLVAQICALARTSSYQVFSAFVRGGDVRRWLCGDLGITGEEYTEALVQLDELQSKLLPERLEHIGPRTSGVLRRICDRVGSAAAEPDVRRLLEEIFAGRTLDERDADAREFAAAAECVEALLCECFSPGVPADLRLDVFARRLDEAFYSLEPDDGDDVATDGWLELPFLDADELVIAGLAEGCVPESCTGHAFLPDSLRRGLGLPCSETRLERDLQTLRLALMCRPAANVSVSFHQVDSAGDALRPSRLLFLCEDPGELAERARLFYSMRAGTGESRAADLPEEWKLNLPVPPRRAKLARISVTRLDGYLACPFKYYLDELFGERLDDRADELGPDEFGSLAHAALEGWAKGPLSDSADAEAIGRDLRGRVEGILAERFGAAVPAIAGLQGESLSRRLECFAAAQAAWRAEGWRIVATERLMSVRYGGTEVRGRVDRVDCNELTGEWCVIDYKTWDTAERAVQFTTDRKTGARTWRSVQLALYVAMLDASGEEPFAAARRDAISSRYCVIGKTGRDVLFSPPVGGALLPEAEAVVRRLIDGIERGVFWPPGREAWSVAAMKYNDFARLVAVSPEDSVNAKWKADQSARIAAAAADGGEARP